ncbi:MAG: hypothetical protein AAFO28_01865 [Pseudomonadota bacterium]
MVPVYRMIAIGGAATLLFAASNSALACGAQQSEVFLEAPVTHLPNETVQVRVSELMLAENEREGVAKATVVEIRNGAEEKTLFVGAKVLLDLNIPPTSCTSYGQHSEAKFIVAKVGRSYRSGQAKTLLLPILYQQRRTVSDEREIANWYNRQEQGPKDAEEVNRHELSLRAQSFPTSGDISELFHDD